MTSVFVKIAKVAQFFVEYCRDLWSFLRFNGYSPLVEPNQRLFYKIIIETHTIEKGLSLHDPRYLFGREKVRYVMSALDAYDVSLSTFPAEMALGALNSYLRFHRDAGIGDPLLDQVEEFVSRWTDARRFELTGGVKRFSLTAGYVADNAGGLLSSRSSFRMFDGLPLDERVVNDVVALAQSAPSQCNRQSSKAHLYQSRQAIDALLALQGGSRGFSGKVGNLLVVTSEIAAWGGAGQRNQPYVDGALFAMNILLACHALGLAACPLNLAITNSVESRIRREGNIPGGERLVMMIAFGNPVDEPLRVASSPRRQLSEVLKVHLLEQDQ